MTFEERTEAIAAFGFTRRQAQFLVLVALHSGYCLRRQYEMFAGIRYGKNVRDFLDGLVHRRWADRFTGRADRGHVYHLHARALYRALRQEENRNRRKASAAQIARKVMLLDCVLSRPDVVWYATEEDKVALFVTRFDVPLDALPRRLFDTTAPAKSHTARYFVHKLPIYVTDNPPHVHFVYLATEGSEAGLTGFLRDHRELLGRLSTWTVVAIGPVWWSGLRAAFERYLPQLSIAAPESDEDLQWYFNRRRIVDSGDLAQIPVGDLRRFRELRQRYNAVAYDAQYASSFKSGAASAVVSESKRREDSVGRLVVEALPFSYEQFGSLPGVA